MGSNEGTVEGLLGEMMGDGATSLIKPLKFLIDFFPIFHLKFLCNFLLFVFDLYEPICLVFLVFVFLCLCLCLGLLYSEMKWKEAWGKRLDGSLHIASYYF